MQSLISFLIEKEMHAKATGDSVEKEAATLLRQALPSHLHVSFGRGKTKEGGDAPDIIIHGPEHVAEGGKTLAHSTKVAHAILTKKKSGWAFTVLSHHDVHHLVAKHAPALTHGIKAGVRKRPNSTEKNPKSINYGKAIVSHAISFRPISKDSIPHVHFHTEGNFTENGHALIHAITQHVKEHGPFVIDVKSGGATQLSNIVYNAKREPKTGHLDVSFESSSLPKSTKESFTHFIVKHAGHHIDKYMNDISALVGHPVHTTRVVKHRTHIDGKPTAPAKNHLDIPESKLKTVKFSHSIGTEQEAAHGARLTFERPATGYDIEEHKGS